MKIINEKSCADIVDIVRQAGEKIMYIYNQADFSIEYKKDESPLTIADKEANDIIENGLRNYNIPILSEEGKNIPYEERKNWEYFWLVDPLDGTKEFIKKNGEFTVNIALIHNGQAIWGIVFAPAISKLYYIDENDNVLLIEKNTKNILLPQINKTDFTSKKIKVVASRSHMDEITTNFLASLNEPELVSMGSSLKFMMVAEKKADIYPRFAPTMEWDTAAAHAILSKLGYAVIIKDSSDELKYNKPNLLNPSFIVK